MRAAVLTFVMFAFPAAAASPAGSFSFPDDIDPVVSPTGSLVANYHREADDNPLRFAVQDADGKEIAGLNFERGVDGAWQPGSNNLYVNEATGSNSGDCFILTQAEDGTRAFASLRAALNAPASVAKDFDWIKPAQLAEDAHYYLSCTKWADGDKIDFTVSGHTDAENGAFKYFMQYDLSARAFKFVPGTN
jgi:hypothetical protein